MKFLKQMIREFNWIFVILLVLGCANVLAVRQIPEIILGEETFFPTIEAYTEAPIVGGNRIEVLLNGDETFPSMLREIRSAQSTITFAQYFYEGPVVKFLQAAFAESWPETTGIVIGGNGYFPRLEPVGNLPAQIVKSSPAGGSFQNYMLFLLSINSAKKSIFITNPYFIPDDVMTEALLKAAGRGVRVVVLAPGKIDSQLTYTASRGHYGTLLLGGVQIFEYQASLMHAKTMVIDGVWATIGSTNFDNRSFALNQELNLTVYDSGVARRLEEVFQEDLKYSKQVTYEEWQSPGIFERFFELFAFPIKEQL